MRWQRFEWSCGAASVVNAYRCFGINLDEARVIPVAGTCPPSRCAHCKKLQAHVRANACACIVCANCKLLRKLNSGKDCVVGTSEIGILKALRHFGGDNFSASAYTTDSRDDAWQWLHGSLLHGRVAILCIDRWSHWCLAMSTSGNRVTLFDPYPSKKNLRDNGVYVLTKDELMRRWWNGKKWAKGERRLYAISMGKR